VAGIVLCFEDDGLLAETYRKSLSRDFHQLVAFKGTDDLARRIKQSRADLLLVDLEALKPESCSGLCSYLKNVSAAQSVPVIGVTGDPTSALCLPPSAFILKKPVPIQGLRDAVQTALQALRALHGVERAEESDQPDAEKIAAPDVLRSARWFQEAGEPICPFFKKATADWLYPVTGYCRGRLDGKLMIPSIAEYRQLCTTEHFRSCETYRSKRRFPHDAAV